jgi:hypothetical protein
MFKHFASAIVFFCFCAAAHARDRIDADYHGPDAGVLVFSTSTLKISMNFDFYFKHKGADLDSDSYGPGKIECACVGFWHPTMSDADYHDDYETGKVQIQYLAPGDYEVYTYNFGGSVAGVGFHYFPAKPLSLPFTIRQGQTTYIGNFARAPSLGTPLADKLGAEGYFIVSDRSDRDIAIAKQKEPNLPPVTDSVTDVSQFELPNLLTKDPYRPVH